MNFFGIGQVVEGVGKIADDLTTTEEERLKHQLQEKQIDADLVKAQIDVNTQEAKHKSVFVAGWRPFIGWVGGLALAYQFLVYPLLVWLWALLQAYEIIPCHLNFSTAAEAVQLLSAANASATVQSVDLSQCSFTPPPVFDATVLFSIVTGMLGIGGMRSYDKLKNTDTKKVG